MTLENADDLLTRAQAGDQEAMARLLMEHQGFIRTYVARLAPDPVSADDLVQEVFLAALRSLSKVDPALGIRGFLLGIARNMVRMAWRKRMHGKEVAGDAIFEMLASELLPAEDPDRSDRRIRALRDCLRQLAPKAAEIMLRHYRDEERCDEIAGNVGTTASNVRMILTRTRRVLRDCMNSRLGTVHP
jgi:RNA polymerase sigma-70 factor (ECF subfamily)